MSILVYFLCSTQVHNSVFVTHDWIISPSSRNRVLLQSFHDTHGEKAERRIWSQEESKRNNRRKDGISFLGTAALKQDCTQKNTPFYRARFRYTLYIKMWINDLNTTWQLFNPFAWADLAADMPPPNYEFAFTARAVSGGFATFRVTFR